MLDGLVAQKLGDGLVRVSLGSRTTIVARWRAASEPEEGMAVTVAFRADRVVIEKAPGSRHQNAMLAQTRTATYLGTHIDYALEADGLPIQAHGSIDDPVMRGETVVTSVSPDHAHVYPA